MNTEEQKLDSPQKPQLNIGAVIGSLLKTVEERLAELEAKEPKDDFLNGQIYEATLAVIHLKQAYLNSDERKFNRLIISVFSFPF